MFLLFERSRMISIDIHMLIARDFRGTGIPNFIVFWTLKVIRK